MQVYIMNKDQEIEVYVDVVEEGEYKDTFWSDTGWEREELKGPVFKIVEAVSVEDGSILKLNKAQEDLVLEAAYDLYIANNADNYY